MEKYVPLYCGNKSEWLELDEDERLTLVMEYHENLEDEFVGESPRLHAIMHVIVENQIAQGEVIVENTIARLMRQSLTAHESVHAVAAILSEELFALYSGEVQEFPEKKYRRKLEKLTAKRWRKGQF